MGKSFILLLAVLFPCFVSCAGSITLGGDAGGNHVPDGGDTPGTCEDVACSGHGTCVATGGEPRCDCGDGYAARGLSCLPIPEGCGNGKIDGGEQCDDQELGGVSCGSLGLGSGALNCRRDCTLDASGCEKKPSCGDGTCAAGETSCACPADCGRCSGCCEGDNCMPGIETGACGSSSARCVVCGEDESCARGACVAGCGDGTCSAGETSCACPADCGQCSGCCEGGDCKPGTETGACGFSGARCAQCGEYESCTGGTCVAGCGDGACLGDETSCTCPQDCGACAGCCDAGACLDGSSDAACGSGGAACEACGGGRVCHERKCGCSSHASFNCNGDDLWWFDSCGNAEAIYSDCGGLGCEGGSCGAYNCIKGCRNGSEICDDEHFRVPSPYSDMFLVCVTGEGGVGYVATNTGPPCQEDGVRRCRGWEEQGMNAWDYLDYIEHTDCDSAGKAVPVDLSQWEDDFLYVGVHDQPGGGGHMTEVCIATLN